MPYISQKKKLIIGALIFILLLSTGIAYQRGAFSKDSNQIVKDSGDGISDYSAVFLSNGQVYFGKMYKSDGETVDLRTIYYLQVNQDLQKTGNDTTPKTDGKPQPDVVLVKLGEELHGPNDRMTINKDQVLFTESLKSTSKVVDAIKNYKK